MRINLNPRDVFKQGQKGFTLLELLISMAIFTVLSAMAYFGLANVLNAKDHTEKQADRLISLQRAFTFIGRDIEQASGRPARDSFGEPVPALTGSGFGLVLLEFTREGVRNPMRLPRSSLQRVAYRLEEENLIRVVYPALDQGNSGVLNERVLLKKVKELEVRYLTPGLEWQDAWPVSLGAGATALNVLPKAVEIKIDVEGFGEIKRLFRVAPGEAVIPQPAAAN